MVYEIALKQLFAIVQNIAFLLELFQKTEQFIT